MNLDYEHEQKPFGKDYSDIIFFMLVVSTSSQKSNQF